MNSNPTVLDPAHARRTAGLLTACGALLVAGLTAAPDARAEESAAEWGADVYANTYRPGVSCLLTGDANSFDSEPLPGGGRASAVLEGEFSVANPEDATDTQAFALDATTDWSLRDSGDGFRDLRFSSTGQISGSAALGEATQCETYLGAESYLQGRADAPTDGFVELALNASGDMAAELGVLQAGATQASLAAGPGRGKFKGAAGTFRAFVEAGEFRYYTYSELAMSLPEEDGWVMSARRVPLDLTSAGGASGTMTFVEAGSAFAQGGNGKKYVKLLGRSCDADKVTAKFGKKAKKAKKVTFSVDGTKAKTVKKVKPGGSVSIGGLGASKDVTVEAAVTLKKKGKKATTTRSYVACAG